MAPSTCELWIVQLVTAVPRLRLLFDEHCADYDGLLPHVFLGEVARYVVHGLTSIEGGESCGDGHSDAVEILRVLDEAVMTRIPALVELVSVSFLENIDWASAEGEQTRSALGKGLCKEMSRRESQ